MYVILVVQGQGGRGDRGEGDEVMLPASLMSELIRLLKGCVELPTSDFNFLLNLSNAINQYHFLSLIHI